VTLGAALLLPLRGTLKPTNAIALPASAPVPTARVRIPANQSLIAVGFGGIWGNSRFQTHSAFLPSQTDFIFAALPRSTDLWGLAVCCYTL
jgi:hypothetical protein